MLRVLWNGQSAMVAQQEKLDCISNNLANVNTDGYKREDVSFKDTMYETLDRRGYPVNKGAGKNLINGTGVRTGKWIRDQKQGNLVNTGSNTDLAIDGPGYFRVTTPHNEKRYIRSGNFNVDVAGDIVDKNGNKVDIQFNEENEEKIRFTKDNFSVNEEGTVFLKNGVDFKEVGKLNIYDAVGDDAFMSVGENLYKPKQGVNPTPVKSDILQGYVEKSNVDMGKEMTDMIMTQRAFEFGSRVVKTADEMWGMANNMRSR